ncbi:MAG: type 4a pilus biogenesis protein PilO [Pirellulaceae bacterium]|nr:type 4a pilus biogenesis protein PilO [Planctomycetales bacterium]MCA9225200.1 type 4a pilus biogenesis protein PilO [Planctomycetales bacterium]
MRREALHNPGMTIGWTLHGAGLLSVIGGVVLFYGLFFAPLEYLRSRNTVRARELETTLRELPGERAANERLRGQLKQLESSAEKLRARIPDQPLEAEFFDDLTELAQRADLRISDYRRGETSRSERLSKMNVHLVGNSSYEGICRFVDGLYSLARLVQIEDLEIRAEGASDDYPITMTLLLFYQPTLGTVGDGGNG